MLQQRQRTQVRQTESEVSNINMTTLHCKLQEEAEKIRKWQTSSDIELKQKVTKLKECEQLISKQRNQVLELQVENESLSTKLQKEQFNQAQINLKLKTSRELFIALKNHSENLQSSIIRGEEDRDSLRMLAAENIRQIKELKLVIQETTESSDKQILVLTSCIKEKELAIEEIKFKSQQEVNCAMDSNKCLENELKKTKVDIDDLSRRLLEEQGIVSSNENKIKLLEGNLKDQEKLTLSKVSELAELQKSFNLLNLSLKSAHSEAEKIHNEQLKLRNEYGSYRASAEDQIDSLQCDQTRLTDSLTNLSTQFNEITSKHDRLEDENATLKQSISQLVKCIEELQEKQEENEQEISQLNEENCSARKRETDFKSSIQEKEDEIEGLRSVSSDLQAKIETMTSQMSQQKAQMDDYSQTIRSLEFANEGYKVELDRLKTESSDIGETSKKVLQDLELKTAENLECKTKLIECENRLKSTISSLNESQSELARLSSTNNMLELNIRKYSNEHKRWESQFSDLDTKFLSLNNDHRNCSSQLKSTKELLDTREEEMKTISSNHNRLKKEIKDYKIEIQALVDSKKGLENALSCARSGELEAVAQTKEIALQNEELQIEKSNLETKICKLEHDLRSAESGSSDISRRLSLELQEATSKLSTKDSTIEMLQAQINGPVNELKSKYESLDKENKQLTSSLSNKNADISALAEELDKLQKKNKKLEEADEASKKDMSLQVTSLKEEIKNLEKVRSDLMEKESTNLSGKKFMEAEFAAMRKQKDDIEKISGDLKSANSALMSEKSRFKEDIKLLKLEIENISSERDKLRSANCKLEDKEAQVKQLKQSLEDVKSDFLLSEQKYLSTIDKMKEEIKKLNKNKVQSVLSNVASKSPNVKTCPDISYMSPESKEVNNAESPKTPSVGRSKKRRVVFGKSPSWHSASEDNFDEEEEDTTVSSSTGNSCTKIRNLTLSKSPKITSYSSSSSKSPKLKLGKPPKPVNDLIAHYPAPSSSGKRGIKLPDAYVKRKEESSKKKQKIKVESCSWFDTETAFGFDEK